MSLDQQIRAFADWLQGLQLPAVPTETQVQRVAEGLVRLAGSSAWQRCTYREASRGEALLYPLAVSPSGGPSLYLVSDGPAVASPPHAHKTWAVIAGIRGCEVNRRYTAHPDGHETAVQSSVIELGPGEVLCLGAAEVHSTEVSDPSATLHLHLYGRPLHDLPSFESRCHGLAHGA